jgi:hypothetical protein
MELGIKRLKVWTRLCLTERKGSVAERDHFYAAPALGKNFDATMAAPGPTLPYSRSTFLKSKKLFKMVYYDCNIDIL